MIGAVRFYLNRTLIHFSNYFTYQNKNIFPIYYFYFHFRFHICRVYFLVTHMCTCATFKHQVSPFSSAAKNNSPLLVYVSRIFHVHGEIKRGRCETSRRVHVRLPTVENTADRIASCHANRSDFY